MWGGARCGPAGALCWTHPFIKETSMSNRIGNKDVAQQRSKSEKAHIKAHNIAREAVKKAEAKAKYRNAVKGQPAPAN
jgi:NRPS condensation-like uncharacterized protein